MQRSGVASRRGGVWLRCVDSLRCVGSLRCVEDLGRRLLLCVGLLVLSLTAPATAWGAGCHYDDVGFLRIDGVADAGPLWRSPGLSDGTQMQRIYRDGRVLYFPTIDGSSLPCNGPNCSARPAPETIEMVPVVESERSSLFACVCSGRESEREPALSSLGADSVGLSHLFPGGLFRPPRAR